jgi:zinc D-Ala-D-Ala carboxypeptidase
MTDYKYFNYKEFDQFDLEGSGEENMDKQFIAYLDELRKRCGFPLVVSSGYRTPAYNNAISTTGLRGAHTTGKACDIVVSPENVYRLLCEVFSMGVFTGIGINQKGNKRFVHLDILTHNEGFPRPRVWTY